MSNKLYDYAVEAGKVFQTLVSPEPKQIFTTERALNGPPEALLLSYASAVVEIARLHSTEASVIYNQALTALLLPGNQRFLEMCGKKHKEAQRQGARAIRTFIENKKPSMLELTSELQQFETDKDYIYLVDRIREFVKVGLNRQKDQADKRYKVLLENSPTLFFAIIVRLISESANKLETLLKYRPDKIDQIMSSKQKGEGRRVHDVLTKSFHNLKKEREWVMVKSKTVLKHADQWYKCRVEPGSIEIYINSLVDKGITNPDKPADQGRVSDNIRPFDIAVGYPYKRPKT